MYQERLVILILLQLLTSADEIPCGNQVLQMPKGTIKYNEYFQENVTCIWRILPAKHTITSLKILSFSCDKCRRSFSCCLLISSYQQLHLKLCNQNLKKLTWLSLRQSEIAVILNTCGGSTSLRLDFSTRKETECPKSEFQCLDGSNCFNSSDICGNEFICNDHSDHLACGGCNEESTPCNNHSDYCFAISQRCNDALNCPKGEDEINCTTLCPQFKCPLEQKCITSEQICDRNIDCMGGFDENNCINDTKAPKILIISTMIVLSSLCCTLFLCLIVRWVITRRDINRFLENMPEFPLEPFQGPGEDDSGASSSEAEFRAGGEFYEHYLHALKKSNRYSKAVQVGGITPKYSHLELDGDNELVVLASLNVPTDMCVGLSLENSSSLTSLKSVRNTNGTSSSSGDDRPTQIVDTKSELNYNSSEKVTDMTRKRNQSKSDTTSHRINSSSSVHEHISKPSRTGTLVLRKSSKSQSSYEKLIGQGDTSRPLSYLGSGECTMESHAQQPQSVPEENSNVTKSNCEIKQDGRQMDQEPNPNSYVTKSGTNLDKFEPSSTLMKSLSAPLCGSKRYERVNKVSKSITNVKENLEINTDKIEIDPQSFEVPLRSDSSQWTDFEDSLKRSNIILVKTLDEKPKPLKRSCKKKVSYSCK